MSYKEILNPDRTDSLSGFFNDPSLLERQRYDASRRDAALKNAGKALLSWAKSPTENLKLENDCKNAFFELGLLKTTPREPQFQRVSFFGNSPPKIPVTSPFTIHLITSSDVEDLLDEIRNDERHSHVTDSILSKTAQWFMEGYRYSPSKERPTVRFS